MAAASTAAQSTFDTHRLGHLVFLPEAREMLKHARGRGLKTVMITNGHHKVQRDKLAAVKAHETFSEPETIIVGGEEVLAGGAEKPHVSIFLKACGVAECEPHEAIHVGDSLATDVKVSIDRACLISFLSATRLRTKHLSSFREPYHNTDINHIRREVWTPRCAPRCGSTKRARQPRKTREQRSQRT